jgi:WD40 repeat protein
MAFSPDGTALASGNHDGTVQLWNVATASQTALLEGHSDWVFGVAFSPDGTILASASNDGSVRLWNVATATQTTQLDGHNRAVRAIAFSPDGATLVTASNDGTVQLWNVARADLLVSVRLGAPVGAVALRDRELAVGLDRAVACFLLVDRDDQVSDRP